MGVSSKLVMTTPKKKDIFPIATTVEKAINDMLYIERKSRFGDDLKPWTKDDKNSNRVEVEANLTARAFIYRFTYKGDSRQLWLFTDCDQDNKHMTDKPNVFLSFNQHGDYEEILNNIYSLLEEKYPRREFFFDFNDCDGKYHKVKSKKRIELEE